MYSQSRQIDGCANRVEEGLVGTLGVSNGQHWIQAKGKESWTFRGQDPNPYRQEHLDLINSIRAGKPLNEARTVAESTLTAIMGRESCYSGQVVEWDAMLNSSHRLGPAQYAFGDLPFPDIAIPGKYKLG